MLNSSRRYDVIIIGAGLEGLLCAALLAKRGKQVIVLEESAAPGGDSTHVVKDGHTFIKGPTLFLGFERDGLYDRLFTELGLSLSLLKREGVLFQKTQPPLQIVLPDHRLDYYTEPGELLEELTREFPDQVQELKLFWTELERWEGVIRPRMHQAHRTHPGTMPDWIREIRGRLRYASAVRAQRRQRASEFLRRHGLNPEIRCGLELLLLIFLEKTAEEATALDLIHLLGLIHREMITVSGGIPRLSELLRKVIGEHHGEIVRCQPAAEIILRHRFADGIRTADGETIHGTSMILNHPRPPAASGPSPRKPFTLYFSVMDKALPSPMKNHLLFLRSYERASVRDNFLYLRVNSARDHWAAPSGRRALQVVGYLPDSNDLPRDALDVLVKTVRTHLAWLMPFSESALTFLGEDLGESEAGLSLKLMEQVRTTRAVARDGARYTLTSLKNLYLLPDLGRRPVAALESARSAFELANQITKN